MYTECKAIHNEYDSNPFQSKIDYIVYCMLIHYYAYHEVTVSTGGYIEEFNLIYKAIGGL